MDSIMIHKVLGSIWTVVLEGEYLASKLAKQTAH